MTLKHSSHNAAASRAAEAASLIANCGFCLLPQAVGPETVDRLLERCREALTATADDRLARSSRGHVYAARNLLQVIPGSHLSKTDEGAGVDAAVAIHATAGDVLAMRPLISHSSGASHLGTTRHRRILHLEFAADEQLPDGYHWHDFIASGAADELCGTKNA